MPVPTHLFPSSLLALAFCAALLQGEAKAWSCDTPCKADQIDCQNWKRQCCPPAKDQPTTQSRPQKPCPSEPKTKPRLHLLQLLNSIAPKPDLLELSIPAEPPDREGELLQPPAPSPVPSPAPSPVPAPTPAPIFELSPIRGLEPAALEGEIPTDVRASRAFSGPGQYPPRQFRAYGVVAFQSLASTESETNRYISLCKGFLAAIPASAALQEQGVPINEQMVTVWPLIEKQLANTLNQPLGKHDKYCSRIVAATNLPVSHDAIHKANKLSQKPALKGRGPYLIAWSPASKFGNPEATVLILNLSNVTTTEGAVAIFQDWADKIERNPDLWQAGWNINSLRLSLKLWADRWGADVLAILSPNSK